MRTSRALTLALVLLLTPIYSSASEGDKSMKEDIIEAIISLFKGFTEANVRYQYVDFDLDWRDNPPDDPPPDLLMSSMVGVQAVYSISTDFHVFADYGLVTTEIDTGSKVETEGDEIGVGFNAKVPLHGWRFSPELNLRASRHDTDEEGIWWENGGKAGGKWELSGTEVQIHLGFYKNNVSSQDSGPDDSPDASTQEESAKSKTWRMTPRAGVLFKYIKGDYDYSGLDVSNNGEAWNHVADNKYEHESASPYLAISLTAPNGLRIDGEIYGWELWGDNVEVGLIASVGYTW